MVLSDQPDLLQSFPEAQLLPADPLTIEELLEQQGLMPSAKQIHGAIENKMRGMTRVHDRMDKDYDFYTLKEFQPDLEESIAPEDAYTTNAPRVLAEKVISFIAATETIVRTNSDQAQEQQEDVNDRVEELCVGMLNNANRRLRRKGHASVQESLAWYAVVRGRFVAARAILRKRPTGETFDDIIPLDPRHLVVWHGDEEPLAAGYRMRKKIQNIRDEYPTFEFNDESYVSNLEDDQSLDVWEYFCRKPNPDHDPYSPDPFQRHPWVYLAGTVIDDKWARPLHNLWMLTFPIVLAPVTSQPILTPPDTEDEQNIEEHFGESVFAESRTIWKQLNRAASYVQDMMAKASDPQIDVYSPDGSKTLDEGANDKGAVRSLMTNQEEIRLAQQADVNRAAGFLFQILQQDMVAGGLPPQAFGLLDKPLSSVALRQLGNNLEHRILPRLRAVAACIEGCLENLIAQYETGAFEPITVSGRRFDNQRFANRVISAEQIQGHDPVIVKMELALPEDETTRWTVAQMAMQPTVTGEPLASMEWTREHILKMESSKLLSSQNREDAGRMQDPLAMATAQVEAYIKDGDMVNASIWYDRLQVLNLQRQVEAGMQQMQLMQMAQQMGMPLQPAQLSPGAMQQPTTGTTSTVGGALTNQAAGNNQSRNPANGAVPFAQAAGVGNNPSPQAGYNTTAPRQRDTGLVDASGNPIMDGEY